MLHIGARSLELHLRLSGDALFIVAACGAAECRKAGPRGRTRGGAPGDLSRIVQFDVAGSRYGASALDHLVTVTLFLLRFDQFNRDRTLVIRPERVYSLLISGCDRTICIRRLSTGNFDARSQLRGAQGENGQEKQ